MEAENRQNRAQREPRVPFRGAAESFGRLPEAARLGAALLLMVALGAIDYATGFEMSFALFYLLPVFLAAWFLTRPLALLVSAACAATWYLANWLAGEEFAVEYIPYWNALTGLGFFAIVTLLVTELRQVLERATALSRIDYVTGALNSRALHEVAGVELERARRYAHPLAIAFVDVDDFKAINDALGHSTGDEVLRTIVSTMEAHLRVTDVIARVGGDEFVLLLVETASSTARPVIARLREVLLRTMEEAGWPVTFSIGVLCCDVAPERIDQLLREADQLMYSIKRDGKNAIRYATPGEAILPARNEHGAAGRGAGGGA